MRTSDEPNDAILHLICDRARNLIDAHWREIRDIADTPDENDEAGKIKFTLKVDLDFTGKTPCGAVNVAIAPRPIRDGCTFRVEDAEQEKLPLDDTPQDVGTIEISTPGGTTTGPMPMDKFNAAVRKMMGKKAKDRDADGDPLPPKIVSAMQTIGDAIAKAK